MDPMILACVSVVTALVVGGDDRHLAVGRGHVARVRAGQAHENRGTVISIDRYFDVWRSTGSMRSTGVGLPSRSSMIR